jgi:uncharacterized protein (TIGR03437 family)
VPVEFLARASGYSLFLTRDSAALIFKGENGKPGRTLRIVAADANHAASPIGIDPLPGKSNYLLGADPRNWRTNIANFARVKYGGIYPGIDLIFHGEGGQLEYDFVVAPGHDPAAIRLRFEGAQSLRIDREGDLIIRVGGREVRERKPRVYQLDGATRREVGGAFTLGKDHSAGFRLGKYDRGRPLIIDPVLSFSTFLGSSASNSANAVALDPAGHIYVAGTTSSTDFPVTASAFQPVSGGGACEISPPPVPCPYIFVSKFTNDGSTLLFSTYLGGAGQNSLAGMAIDQGGNVYLTGVPSGSDFPKLAPLDGYPAQLGGSYVAKLSADGSSLIYATSLPVTTSAVAVDSTGAVYLTGTTGGSYGGPLPVVNALQSTITKPLVFKTTDAAVHWQGLTNGLSGDLVDSIKVDPTNSQTLYLGMDQALYKSTDGGSTWTAIQNGLPPESPLTANLSPRSLAIDPTNSQTLYLGTDYGVYKSTDGGADWALSGTGANRWVTSVAIDPLDTATLYAVTSADTYSALYKSTDAGATWNLTGLPAPANSPYFVTAIILDPQTPTTLYASTSSGVMKSLDAGVTWAAITSGFITDTDITALVIDPVNPQALYAVANGYNAAPYWTSDGGAHWTQGQWSPDGGLLRYGLCLLVDPVVHTTIWLVTDEGLLVSRDAGATWGAPPTDLPYYNVQRLGSGSDGSIYAIANNDGTDAFVMKLDGSGSKLVYSTYLGGSGSDLGNGIAVDSAGRAYITGITSSFDFPIANALEPHPAGFLDGFVTVLDGAGSQLVWSTYLGGSGDDWPSAIALDPAGDVHLAGWTYSADFPLSHASQSVFAGSAGEFTPNAFATKLKSDGSSLIFSTYLGGSNGDSAWAVAADPAGNTYIAGTTASTDFPVLNAVQSTLTGVSNAFVANWNGQTGTLDYSTYLGGSNNDIAHAIAADGAGNAYIAGLTSSPNFPSKYAFQYSYSDCSTNLGMGCTGSDAFLAKISPATGPAIALAGAANAASYGTVVAPGEIVSIFGTALAVTTATAGAAPLPLKLSDVNVSVNGLVAPLLYVSPVQINAQIPFETAAGTAQIQVASSAGTASLEIAVAPAAPAIFTLNSTGSGAGAIEHGLTGQAITDANPAAAGEIVSVYCTGLGAVNPPGVTGAAGPIPPAMTVLQVRAYVAGEPATVSYAGLAPGYAGLYQINVQIPAGTPSGAQTLQVSAGGAGSNTVSVAIQ